MKKFLITVLTFKITLLFTAVCFSQTTVNLKELVFTHNTFENDYSKEKIYLDTDKPNYNVSDTLWYKAYLFNANYYDTSSKSNIVYVEIANDSNLVVKRMMLPVVNGLTYGDIYLDDELFSTGGYVIRAYTNWMRNFDEELTFQKRFTIQKATTDDWLIKYQTQQAATTKNSYLINLNLSKFQGSGLILNDLELSLSDGRKRLLKEKLKTDIAGNVSLNALLPENINKKGLVVGIKSLSTSNSNKTYSFPLVLNSIENIDLQFMPESGDLVDGIGSKVGFKAINSLGIGTNISAELYEEGNSKKLLDFATTHNGMGSFHFIPHYGKTYFAKLKTTTNDATSKTFTFPTVKDKGVVMEVVNSNNEDSLTVHIYTNNELEKDFYFFAQARNLICFASKVQLVEKNSIIKLSKNLFPTGVTSLSLNNKNKEVVNQRLVYIDHKDQLKIELLTNKEDYDQRDSVGLNIKVTDSNGLPVRAYFSLAVTDDFWVNKDTLKYNSIKNYMNLSSHLKGNIEEVGYYTNAVDDKLRWEHLDNLLLTQGWTSYISSTPFETHKIPALAVEKEFIVSGKVVNAFNKPVQNSGVSLFSNSPLIISNTITDSLGRFYFKNIFPVDTAKFFIQAKNKRDKSFNIGIKVDEFVPPSFAKKFFATAPWNVNIDTDFKLKLTEQIAINKSKNYKLNGNVLQEVIVVTKKIVKGSENLNGPGEADVVLDQEAIEKAGKLTLRELLALKIPTIRGTTNKYGNRFYVIAGKRLHVLIDGIDIESIAPEDTTNAESYFNEYFDYYTAKDLKGVELMETGKYALSYVFALNPMLKFYEHAFLEVTTRGGKGPFLKKSIGTYLFKPMAFSLPNKFYSPKYSTISTPDVTDIRSTIYWEPNFETDQNGMAKLNFYTSDHTGNYSINIQGTNGSGLFGAKQSVVTVKK